MTEDRTGLDHRYCGSDREAGSWALDAGSPDRSTSRPSVAGGASSRSLWLARTLDREILPRLLRRQSIRPVASAVEGGPPAAALDDLVQALRSGDDDRVSTLIDGELALGMSTETVLLDLLTPAARHFGELWVADLVGFAEVTLVVCALQHQLRRIAPSMTAAGGELGGALLLPTPGEQHSFGLLIVAEFMRKAGWAVRTEFCATSREIGRIVGADWFGLVGLSIGGVALRQVLTDSVAEIRRRSANPDVVVVLGGPAVLIDPALADEVGADGAARDAREAVDLAARLGERHERRLV